jgi:hypothetical protein
MGITILDMGAPQMKAFEVYVDRLQSIALDALDGFGAQTNTDNIEAILDGEVARKFRSYVPLKTRRRFGAFFTGRSLAGRLSRKSLCDIYPNSIIADPACGTGNLLLAAADELPIGSNVTETLEIWGSRLMGFDINEHFLRAAKARLLLLAISKSPRSECFSASDFNGLFPMISQRDFLACPEDISKASHILINPPYNQIMAPLDCTWGNRKISAAAFFMDTCLSNAATGAKISAILPDVLRSGSYYEKWRQHIESLSGQMEITTHGQFDDWTDVHVFLLKLIKNPDKKASKVIWWKQVKQSYRGKVGDYFDVHVGPVVPHRDPKKGPSLAYIHARTIPAWGTVNRINERRRFSGTSLRPPFVAVRRTSRPGDSRAIATVITGKRKVAVENHIIVLFPRTKSIGDCRKLLQVLKSPQTDRWLNKRIRCRHLTVGALKDAPWWRI